ncbi:hypothetical protein UB45_02550 [Terrabacter sp. 28]|jgi:hypothetical protein|nr:hypothetical protein UB45_02550 [Terrabacter sp. 28]
MGSGGNLPVGPGIWGFIAFFVLAISLWLLVRNMNSRLRRMAYRDRDEAAARAETEGTAEGPEPDPTRDAPLEGGTAGGTAGDAPVDGPDDRPVPRND